ncbi:MAG: efflux RND transporter periplasmic adaptor subunit [Deltaproteobacteria bacterium]|nr:efflux RND transporter periplasmic adaptor subunit [Deltaproteobacteria bacterium]
MKEERNAHTDIERTLGLDRSAGGGKHLKRLFLWGIPVLIAVVLLILWAGGNGADTVSFKTQPAQKGDLVVTVSATGNLEPKNQVDVSSELSGIIDSVDVDYNDHVTAGQVLARLDTDKLEAGILQSQAVLTSAEARILQARATLKESRTQLERLRKAHELSSGKVPSRKELDAAEAAVDRAAADEASARAQVAEARAALEVQETERGKASIRSPINGVVLSRDVEPGQTVASSLQAPVLFTLAEDLTKMELHVDIDEADVGQVKDGQEATFTVDAYPDWTFPARIKQVRYGARTSEGVVTYTAVLDVDNSELLLRPGMTATADITVEHVQNAVLVPNAALRFTPPAGEENGGKRRSSGNGGVIGALLPHPPRQERKETSITTTASEQRVWTLRDDRLMPVSLVTGATDGIMTEVRQGDIEPGMPLVVGTENKEK